MNEEDKKTRQEEMAGIVTEVKQVLSDKGPDAAIAFIQGLDDLGKIVNTFNNLIFDLYNKEKNLKWLVPVAKAGIEFCLGKSEKLSVKNPELATKLKTVAKTISFNLASFTWPGWNEEGIAVTETDLAAGLEAAQLNIKLVEELGADPAQLSNSYWSVGSHYIARKTPTDYNKAKQAFEKAKEYGIKAGSKDSEHMNAGYVAIARILAGEDAQSDFNQAVKALSELGTGDAKFFASQLADVLDFFSTK